VLVGGLWLASSLAGCARAETQAQVVEAPQSFPVSAPMRQDARYERAYVGQVRAHRYAELRSRLRGVIEAVEVDEGQAVKHDQVLFSVSAREAQQELLKARAATKAAEAELQLAQIELDNTRMLAEKKVVSRAELALAESKVELLKAQIEQAKASEGQASINVTYAKLRAPFDGAVNRIPLKTGSLVGENELLTTLADTSEVLVYFRVSEREYFEYAAGGAEGRPREVTLELADGSRYAHAGVVDAVESELDQATGNLAFRARFPNPDGVLKHGSSGKVIVATALPDALVVPQKSTFEVQGRLFVYAVDGESKARAREIVPKVRLEDSFVIASGLQPEERFVLEGVQKIKDGVQIEAVPSS